MKSYTTFFLIAVMTLGLVFLLVTRERSKHDAPAEVLESKEPAVSADAGVEAGSGLPGSDAAAVDAAPKAPAERPLRIASLGWELAAAGAAISPSAGGPPAAPVPSFELAPETALDAIEARLARGGTDPQGADVAVLPLPAFVASFERLRALEPRAFLVVGFSHGREELRANAGALLKAPPGADEVRLVGFGPGSSASDPGARASGSESATVLGLFALDLLGVGAARIRLVPTGAADAKGALVSAIVKGTADDRKLAFSTTDASHLVPIVAIAPRALLEAREPALREWAKAWLEGLVRTKSDVPGIARRLASKEMLPLAAGVGGAPEALVLVERLGQIENTALDDQTSLVGPLATGPVTLESLLQKTWSLARTGGLATTAAPEALPIDARIIAMIAPPPRSPAPTPTAEGDAGAPLGPIAPGSVPLVVYRAAEGDAEKVALQIAFLAGVFERAAFRITAKGGAKAALGVAAAARAKGVAANRLATLPVEPAGAFATVEVLAPP